MSADPYLIGPEGERLYVRTTRSWGRTTQRLVAGASLTEAKQNHGWTRERHTAIQIRRARQSDAPLLLDHYLDFPE